MADAKGPAGNNAQWLPRQGTLKWQHVPGHAPGQVLIPALPFPLHLSSQTLTKTYSVGSSGAAELRLPTIGLAWVRMLNSDLAYLSLTNAAALMRTGNKVWSLTPRIVGQCCCKPAGHFLAGGRVV